MSRSKISTCRLLLKEQFGDVAESIANCLLKRGSYPLKLITAETSLKLDQVKRVLSVFIQQNLVQYEQSKRGFTEYHLKVDECLWRLRFPRYIYCVKTLYGDTAELLLEDVLQKGQSVMGELITTVTQKLNEALEDSGQPQITPSTVYDKFCSLVGTHFIKRYLVEAEEDRLEIEAEFSGKKEVDDRLLFKVPPMEVDMGEITAKRKRSMDESDQPLKKLKIENGESKKSHSNIYWRVNFDRFHQHFRDQALISAVANKLDKRAAEVLRTMLRLSEVRTATVAMVTNPMSLVEIQKSLPKDIGLTKQLLEQYLSILSDDSTEFVSRIGDSGGGTYVVNLFKGITNLCKAHIESVVQERFGSKSLRIFRVLLLKKHLEQKQIEEFAMIPAKEAKDLLYTMFAQNFVQLTEVSKTPDHAPSRTYYLFTVDIQQVARMLLEKSYKSLCNAMMKRGSVVQEHKRLLEKQERVEAIVASLEQSGTDATQRDEIEQTITPAEQTTLAKVKRTVNMLDHSELQLDDTIFTLETYLFYTDQKNKFNL